MTNYLVGEVLKYSGNIHDVAKDNPMMSENAFKGLLSSIQEIGQQEPIKVWRGKVVDGRNRLKALETLGIIEVKYITLPHKATREYLQAIADGSEARRHQTATQLAIKAFRVHQKTGLSLKTCATRAGVSLSSVNLVSAISKIRPDILKILQDGKLFKLSTGYATDSLQSINKDLKKLSIESSLSPEDIEEMIGKSESKTDEDKRIEQLVGELRAFIVIAKMSDADIRLLGKAVAVITEDAYFDVSDETLDYLNS